MSLTEVPLSPALTVRSAMDAPDGSLAVDYTHTTRDRASRVHKALRAVDTKGDGSLTREEYARARLSKRTRHRASSEEW